MNKPINIAFSPCPNDTFIFDALVHGRIDTEGLSFTYALEDVETLNKAAEVGQYDVSKLSFHGFYHVAEQYVSLTSGAALCDNFGPVLVGKQPYSPAELEKLTVAVPGLRTSAALLFSHFFKAHLIKPFLFSDIEHAVIEGIADAGIIIHENVFTFQSSGLVEIANLGTLWTQETGLPVPLGCIAVKRSLPQPLQQKINRLVQKSVQYAFDNPRTSYTFVKQNAVNLSDEVIQKHIKTYVNAYSLILGNREREAVKLLYMGLVQTGALPPIPYPLFVDELK